MLMRSVRRIIPGTMEDKDERHEGSRARPRPSREGSVLTPRLRPRSQEREESGTRGVRRESIDLTGDNRMNEKEQRTARAPFLTRKRTVSGGLAARTPGELQGR